MNNVRERLHEKLAFETTMFNPIIESAAKKLIRTGVKESIYTAAGKSSIGVEPSSYPSSAIIYVPTPVPESDAPDAPTVVRNIPISISVGHGVSGSPSINATPIIPAEGVQLEDVSQSRQQMA